MNLTDTTYCNIAREQSNLSKDENTKVGAVILDSKGVIVSVGRNGTVSGFNDAYIPFSREVKTLEYLENGTIKTFNSNKYPFMNHAEYSAIYFAENKNRLVGATLYCTVFPCSVCALNIATHKLKRIVVPADCLVSAHYSTDHDRHLAKFIFAQAGIILQVGDEVLNLEAVS